MNPYPFWLLNHFTVPCVIRFVSQFARSYYARARRHRRNNLGGFSRCRVLIDWPYLWIDATYVKVRESGRIVSVAVIVVVGVNGDGRREVLAQLNCHTCKRAFDEIEKWHRRHGAVAS